MPRLFLLALTLTLYTATTAEETVLSSVLTPRVSRQLRGYYDYRYGRPLYDRLEYRDDRRCGRCDDKSDRSGEDDDDYDDRRHKPTSGKRYDKKDDDDGFDRPKNATDDKDDKDRPSRRKHKNRYDDRDRYRPDYYDRFLRDPYRERDYDRYRPYDRYPYDDPYAYRRPAYDRYDDGYGGYGPSAGRGPHESFRPWDETYRGQSGWDAAGRGYYFASGRPEPSYRPEYARPVESGWGGTSQSGYQDPYRGSGYGGGYQNPSYSSGGYSQNPGYGQSSGSGYGQSSGYRDPYASYGGASGGYAGASGGYGGASGGYGGYGSSGSVYGTPSGWHSVNERRPYRDESGVNGLNKRNPTDRPQNGYQTNRQSYDNRQGYDQDNAYGQTTYGQPAYGKPSTYGKDQYGKETYGKDQYGKDPYGKDQYGKDQYGKDTYGKDTYAQNASFGQSSTTQETSYLFQRADENATTTDETTKAT